MTQYDTTQTGPLAIHDTQSYGSTRENALEWSSSWSKVLLKPEPPRYQIRQTLNAPFSSVDSSSRLPSHHRLWAPVASFPVAVSCLGSKELNFGSLKFDHVWWHLPSEVVDPTTGYRAFLKHCFCCLRETIPGTIETDAATWAAAGSVDGPVRPTVPDYRG